MAIVPMGKILIMKAQTIANPISQEYIDSNERKNMFSDIQSKKMEQKEPIVPIVDTQVNKEIEDEEENTIEKYIFKKLELFGWPGRLLQEYKDKFVSTSIASDGTEDIRVEILDKIYPNMKQISKNEIRKIIKEIQNQFGLHFQGGDNSDAKWSLRFSSRNLETQQTGMQNEQDIGATVLLDKAYGVPSKNKKGKSPVNAKTFNEMIKLSKNEIINKFIKNYFNKAFNGEK